MADVISGAGGVGTGTGVTTGGGMTMGGLGVDGAGGGTGAVVQAASVSATAPSETSRLPRVNDMGMIMWILMLEGGVALFLLVFIVWWTMYSGKKPTGQDQEKLKAPDRKDPPDAIGR